MPNTISSPAFTMKGTPSTAPFVVTAFAPRDITDSERYENYQSNLATLKQLEKAEASHERMLDEMASTFENCLLDLLTSKELV